MSQRSRRLSTSVLFCLCAALQGCYATGGEDDTSGAGGPGPGGKADLPNEGFYEREHDGVGYAAIADLFRNAGFDVTTDLTKLTTIWPVKEAESAVFTRYGTPIRLGSWSPYAYFHTAFDIYRAHPESTSDEILAPVSGTAIVTDWYGEGGAPSDDYQGVVSIWDPESHVIVQVMHVKAADVIRDAPVGASGLRSVEVKQGDVIGTLANTLSWLAPEHQNRLRHAHTDFIDAGRMLILNPAELLPYKDARAPEVLSVYALGSDAVRHDGIVTDKLDIVVQVADRDDLGERNFEAGSMAYEVVDDAGNVLRASERCYFEHLWEDIQALRGGWSNSPRVPSLSLLDFGSGRDEVTGGWTDSDNDNPGRTFRYALTQFAVNDAGRCGVVPDSEGFIEVPDATASVEVRVRVWDQNNNETSETVRLERVVVGTEDAGAAPQPDAGTP